MARLRASIGTFPPLTDTVDTLQPASFKVLKKRTGGFFAPRSCRVIAHHVRRGGDNDHPPASHREEAPAQKWFSEQSCRRSFSQDGTVVVCRSSRQLVHCWLDDQDLGRVLQVTRETSTFSLMGRSTTRYHQKNHATKQVPHVHTPKDVAKLDTTHAMCPRTDSRQSFGSRTSSISQFLHKS